MHIILQMTESWCQHLTQPLNFSAGLLHNKSLVLDRLSLPGHINVYRLIRMTWENQITWLTEPKKVSGLKKHSSISHKKIDFFYRFIKPIFPECPVYAESVKYSQCFFAQNVLQFIHRGKYVYFLLHSTTMWTDKTVTGRLLLFSFVTGRHKATCYQVKQDKLSHWKPHSETVFCPGQTHTWTHSRTLGTSSSATTT